MNMNSLQILLEQKISKQYLIEQLKDGNTLAQIVLENLCLDKGRFLALLHPSADKNLIYNFRSGGILPKNPLEPVVFRGNFYSGRKKVDSCQELALYLRNILNAENCCYFDDQMHQREDLIAKKYKTETLYYNEELYLFLQKEKFSTEKSKEIIQYVDAQWYYMNVISQEKPGINQEVSIEKLQKIVFSTTHIVVGAYDGEGYLIWEALP